MVDIIIEIEANLFLCEGATMFENDIFSSYYYFSSRQFFAIIFHINDRLEMYGNETAVANVINGQVSMY